MPALFRGQLGLRALRKGEDAGLFMFTGTVLDREGGTESKDHLSAFGFRFLCVSLALSLSLCLSVSPLFFSPLISFIYYHLFFILFVFLLSILPVSSLSSHLFFVFFTSFPPSLSIFPLNLPPYSLSLSISPPPHISNFLSPQ